jgi:protoporphyrin/coproporphyrin ferrochelatase
MSKTGVLLINLGTPDSPQPKSVYKYLKQFLNDPRVIDLPRALRYLLVNWIIVPFRYKKSAHAYQQIWRETGSPLLIYSEALAQGVATELGHEFQVELGMRYGHPSIESALKKLQSCEKIMVIPLFPQYSSAANGSAVEECLRVLGSQWNIPQLFITKDFYNHPAFIKAYAEVVQTHLRNKQTDMIVFSYHGLPERHINKSDCQSACTRKLACPGMTGQNAFCYRAQCFETTRLIAQELGLTESQYMVTFQSRLGRTPWIAPYTDIELPKLIDRNIKNIAIVCPSFVSDCLETLEEINMRAREQWRELGGHEFTFIPCINDSRTWVRGLAEMIRHQSQPQQNILPHSELLHALS